MLSTVELNAIAAGYVKCPNSGTRWYAGSPGLPSFPHFMEVHIETPAAPFEMIQDSWSVALKCKVYGGYPGESVYVARFETWQNFMEYAARNGVMSQPGLPAFLHGID